MLIYSGNLTAMDNYGLGQNKSQMTVENVLDPIPKCIMKTGESADGTTFPNNGIGLPQGANQS